MHVSETGLPRGSKPQEHFHEGDPIKAKILRIDDAEMKVGLSAASAQVDAEPVPTASAEPALAERNAAEPALAEGNAAEPALAEGNAAEPPPAEAPAPKKKRSRKKTDETAAKK
jgi:hypothetical protein